MDEKNTLKLKHTKIFKFFLFVFSVGTMLIFYNNFFGDYELVVQSLQNSAHLLLIFISFFLIFNIHLVAGDNKVKKVFDHLIFFSFLTYIVVFSISLLDALSSGFLTTENIVNHVLVAIVIPLITMITAIWSIRNVKVIGKNSSGEANKKDFINPVYYLLVVVSLLGVVYSLLTPLYSIY